MDMLEKLYRNRYEVCFRPSAAYKKRQSEVGKLWEQVSEAMGSAFEERLYTEDTILREENELFAYRQGFRLGALLMLELLEK